MTHTPTPPTYDLIDVPVGLGGTVWSRSDSHIEAGAGDGFLLKTDIPRNSKHLRNFAKLDLRVAGENIWRNASITPEVFLRSLAENWRALLYRDPSPYVKFLGISGRDPSRTRFIRVGHQLIVVLNRRYTPVSLVDAIEALEEFGHALAVRLPRDSEVVQIWSRRYPRNDSEIDELSVQAFGYSAKELADLGIGAPSNEDELRYPSDLKIAARLTGGEIEFSLLKLALEEISRHAPLETPKLNEHSNRALDILVSSQNTSTREFEEGHDLAQWYRQDIIGNDIKFDIEAHLKSLGVQVRDLDLGTADIDAIAAWGENGPVIVVNKAGRRSKNPVGRRATLAHELCHLLIDRDGALPVAEAQGDRVKTYKPVEERANAFAAELLMPRRTAGMRLRQIGDLDETLESLEKEYQVSRTMVLRQLGNHPVDVAGPTDTQRAEIERLLPKKLRSL